MTSAIVTQGMKATVGGHRSQHVAPLKWMKYGEAMDRFGLGERVKFPADWPGENFPNAFGTIPQGTCATIIQVFGVGRDCYLVRLDTPLPQYGSEYTVQGFDLVPE